MAQQSSSDVDQFMEITNASQDQAHHYLDLARNMVLLLNAGYKVTVINSLVNSSPTSLDRVRALVGEERAKNLTFIEADLVDKPVLQEHIVSRSRVQQILAGLKAVGESVKLPLLYYHNNLTGTFFPPGSFEKEGVHQDSNFLLRHRVEPSRDTLEEIVKFEHAPKK